MVTEQWHVVYVVEGAMNETVLILTGSTYDEVSCTYLEKLSAFGRILATGIVEYKEETRFHKYF